MECGWEDEPTEQYGARAARHRNLLRATLMLLSRHGIRGMWTDHDSVVWKQLTGQSETTARALCDAIRASGLSVDELLR